MTSSLTEGWHGTGAEQNAIEGRLRTEERPAMPPAFIRTVKRDPGPEFLQLQLDIDRIRVCHFHCPWMTQIFASFDILNVRRYLEHGLRDIKKKERNSVLSYRRCSSFVKFSMRNLPARGLGNEEAADEKYGENGHLRLRWLIQELSES